MLAVIFLTVVVEDSGEVFKEIYQAVKNVRGEVQRIVTLADMQLWRKLQDMVNKGSTLNLV